MAAKRQMKLGISCAGLGYHRSAWMIPGVPPNGATDFNHYKNVAQIAERALFDMMFFADSDGTRTKDNPPGSALRTSNDTQFEPITLLAALAAVTSRIGLISTASTTYNDPFHIARKFASIDHLSNGRAGWNVVASWSDQIAQNFSQEKHPDYNTRYERAREFVEVVHGLWDGWEEDAVERNRETGIFTDRTKVHELQHKGKYYQVRGPLNISRTPQGRPVIVQAGASGPGRDFASAVGEVIYCQIHTKEDAQKFYAAIKDRMPFHGRSPNQAKIMPGITPIVGRTEEEALEKRAKLESYIDPLIGQATLYYHLGDLSKYDFDGPVPDITDPERVSQAKLLIGTARRENLSLRQLAQRVAITNSVRLLVGTPKQIADNMEEWFTDGAADGFNICPTHFPVGLQDFADLVIPELQRRGLFRTAYEGTSLRASLGLEIPENRYTKARSQKQSAE